MYWQESEVFEIRMAIIINWGANDKSFIGRLLGELRRFFKVFGPWKKWLHRKSFNYYQTETDKQWTLYQTFFFILKLHQLHFIIFYFFFCFFYFYFVFHKCV